MVIYGKMTHVTEKDSSDEDAQLSNDGEQADSDSAVDEAGEGEELELDANETDSSDEHESESNEEEKQHGELELDASDTESSDEEESVSNGDEEESQDDELELAASETESSDEDENESSADEDDEKEVQPRKTRAEIEAEKVYQKYQDRQGKQLYLRFPSKLPVDETEFQQKVRALSTLIVKAHKPRQKHARFCLVDFDSKQDRDTAYKTMKEASQTDASLKGIVVSIPRTENEEFVKDLAERKRKKLESKQAKLRLKRESKLALGAKNFTSSVVVLNLPKNASMLEVRELFPNAVDIQMKTGKNKMHGTGLASITLPSTMDARTAVKRKLSLGGNKLMVRYDRQAKRPDKSLNESRQLLQNAGAHKTASKKKSNTKAVATTTEGAKPEEQVTNDVGDAEPAVSQSRKPKRPAADEAITVQQTKKPKKLSAKDAVLTTQVQESKEEAAVTTKKQKTGKNKANVLKS